LLLRKLILAFEGVVVLDSLEDDVREVALRYDGYYPRPSVAKAQVESRNDYAELKSAGVIHDVSVNHLISYHNDLIAATVEADLGRLKRENFGIAGDVLWLVPVSEIPITLLDNDVLHLQSRKDFTFRYPTRVTLDTNLNFYHGFPPKKFPPGVRFCYVDPLVGTSIRTTIALLASLYEGWPLVTDDNRHMEFLTWRLGQGNADQLEMNRPRAAPARNASQLAAILLLSLISAQLSEEKLLSLPISDLLDFRNRFRDERSHLVGAMNDLAATLGTNSGLSETEIRRALREHLTVPVRETVQKMSEVKIGLATGTSSVAIESIIAGLLSSVLSSSIFQGASLHELLIEGAGVTAASSARILPVFLEAALKRRESRRQNYAYIVALARFLKSTH